ncbi:MAG: AAA family ATPase, partial [Actinomycetota bacterium]|nr:AAA family ATPase [Actinomycetota bacterium]
MGSPVVDQAVAVSGEDDAGGTGSGPASRAAPLGMTGGAPAALAPWPLSAVSVRTAMMDPVIVDRIATALVGRTAELAELRKVLGTESGAGAADSAATNLRAGSGQQAVLLAGDAGVGKSRLLAELVSGAHGSHTVLIGHCLDFAESAPPYLPFVEMFGRFAEENPAQARDLAARHLGVAQLLDRRGALGAAGSGEATPALGRDDLRADLQAALTDLGSEKPLLVVVEDAHWADRSTRDVLGLLFSRGFGSQVSLVVSYRSDDVHRKHPLRAAAAEWMRLSGVRRLTLEPLPDPEVRNLVGQLAAGALPEATIQQIVARADGNAFFTEELVGAADSDTALQIPDDLAGLLLVRLDRLDDDARTVVSVAAIGGRGVSHELVAQVVALPEDRLEAGLRAAVDVHVLVPVGRDGYGFRHALLAEAVYDDLLPGERRRWHARYVQILAALPDSQVRPGHWAELARHARAARDDEIAVTAGIKAAREARASGGPTEAAEQYRLALDLLESRPALAPEVDRIDVVEQLAANLFAAGDGPAAIDVARCLVDDLPATADESVRARSLALLAESALAEDSWLAFETSEQGLALMSADRPGPLRARLLSVNSRASMGINDVDRTRASAGEALALAERFGLTDVVADVTTTLARLKEYTGDTEASIAELTAVVGKARREGQLSTELRAQHHLGGVHLGAGDLPASLAAYTVAAERASETGQHYAPWGLDARVLAAITAHIMGEWTTADALLTASPAQPAGRIPSPAAGSLNAAAMQLAAGRGERHRGLEMLASIRGGWGHDGLIVSNAGFAAIDLYGDAGDLAAAAAIHDEIVDKLSTMWTSALFPGRIRLSGLLLGQLAAAAAAAGSAERAAMVARGRE